MNEFEVLTEARRLLADKKAWTRQALARDAGGDSVSVGHARACQFCLVGAVHKAAMVVFRTWPGGLDCRDMYSAQSRAKALVVEAVKRRDAWTTPASFNDDLQTRHEDVLAVLDAAVAAADRQARANADADAARADALSGGGGDGT